MTAIALFFVVIAITLAITAWAARRTRSAVQFYAAGSTITSAQNGLAIAGDFMSAATFLGITGLFFGAGFDAIIYIISPLAGLAVILAFFAEPLRAMGRFTLADVLAVRLAEKPARAYAAVAGLTISLMYLTAQIVGAGALIELLFGIEYTTAVVIVGVLMVIYVAVGGMLATTWVQIVKAVLLVIGVSVLAGMVLARTGFSLDQLFVLAAERHSRGLALFSPGGLVPDAFSAFSLAIGLVFGMAGLPHILMRFFTVPNVVAARRSVIWGAAIIAYVFVLIFFVIGIGGVALVTGDATATVDGKVIGGGNMVAIHLSRIVGGEAFLGVMTAIAFATILAVVAGLTLASAATLSHDLYAGVLRHGRASEKEEVAISRLAALAIGIVAIGLGALFEKQNIAYLAALAFTIAASANFPVLILALTWPRLTTRGAVLGGGIGLASSVAMVVLGPAVWIDVLGHGTSILPWRYPALISMAVAFASIWFFSITDRRAS